MDKLIQSVIWWASFTLAIYWVLNWFEHRKLSMSHSAQWICAALLCGVVAFFNRRPEISRYHMLWAMPAAFFGSSLLIVPYIRWRSKRKYPELFD